MQLWSFECEDCDRDSRDTIKSETAPIDKAPLCSRCGARMKPYEKKESSIKPDYIKNNVRESPYDSTDIGEIRTSGPEGWHPKDKEIYDAGKKDADSTDDSHARR